MKKREGDPQNSHFLPMMRPLDDEYADVPELQLVLDDPKEIHLQFEIYHPEADFDEMNKKLMLSWLEHGIDWN